MPRYYFDTFDGTSWMEDQVGVQCSDEQDAQSTAHAALVDLATEEIPNGGERTIKVRVRDDTHGLIETSVDLHTIRL